MAVEVRDKAALRTIQNYIQRFGQGGLHTNRLHQMLAKIYRGEDLDKADNDYVSRVASAEPTTPPPPPPPPPPPMPFQPPQTNDPELEAILRQRQLLEQDPNNQALRLELGRLIRARNARGTTAPPPPPPPPTTPQTNDPAQIRAVQDYFSSLRAGGNPPPPTFAPPPPPMPFQPPRPPPSDGLTSAPPDKDTFYDRLSESFGGRGVLFNRALAANPYYRGVNPWARGVLENQGDPLSAIYALSGNDAGNYRDWMGQRESPFQRGKFNFMDRLQDIQGQGFLPGQGQGWNEWSSGLGDRPNPFQSLLDDDQLGSTIINEMAGAQYQPSAQAWLSRKPGVGYCCMARPEPGA